MTSNTPSPQLVSYVTASLGDGLTEEQVNRVIVAYQTASAGAPLGTVMIHPDTGVVAKRVNVDGVHKWQIVDDGTLQFDERPTLDGWDLLKQGS